MIRTKASMVRAFYGALLFCVYADSSLLAQTSRPVSQSAPSRRLDTVKALSVVVGESVVLDCALPVQRVAVGIGDIAVATAISPSEILVSGKAPGETSLIIWEHGGVREFVAVTVHSSIYTDNDHLEAIRRELRQDLPGQTLTVSSEGGAIFLRGTVKDINSSSRAVQIVSAVAAGKVVNLLDVQVPPAEPQILLKVIFASVDRSLSNQLGINLFSTGLGNTVAGVSTGQFSPPTLSLPSSGTAVATLSNDLNLLAFFPGLNLGATIQALQVKGLVQVLAEPNILAQNGKEGSFLAGGEYPYPVVQGSSGTGTSVTIEFKEYGIRLNFIPTITPRGTIRLQVAPEVSSLDFTNAVEISGFDVPAIDVRKVNTEVELADGQSFAIGGLLDNRDTETFQKIPFLGDIPILGKFFQSISKNKTNTELIVIVTPEIVKPIPVGAPLPHLKYPAKFLPPNSGIPMNTPDMKPAGALPAPVPATMPVEQLIKAMQPEKPLLIDSSSSGSFGANGGGAAASPAPAAPQ
jgi:pilus assembly protein CpaC